MTENSSAPSDSRQTPISKIVVDGVEFAADQLSEEAKAQVVNLHGCDQELARLRQQMAIVQTARMAYVAALKQSLPQA